MSLKRPDTLGRPASTRDRTGPLGPMPARGRTPTPRAVPYGFPGSMPGRTLLRPAVVPWLQREKPRAAAPVQRRVPVRGRAGLGGRRGLQGNEVLCSLRVRAHVHVLSLSSEMGFLCG